MTELVHFSHRHPGGCAASLMSVFEPEGTHVIGTGVVMAIIASLVYGSSNVVSGTAVQRHATASLALWAQAIGLVVIGTLWAVRRPPLTIAGLVWGLVAGAVVALAVLMFYTALQRGRTSVVASVSGAGVVIPVLVGLVRGDSLSWGAGAGVLAAVAGVLLVAAGSGDGPATRAEQPGIAPATGGRPPATPGRAQAVPPRDGCVPRPGAAPSRSAVWLAAGSAVAFGSFFVLLQAANTRGASGVGVLDAALPVSLAVQTGALAVTLVAATRHARHCLRLRRAVLLPATTIGLLDVSGDLLLTVAVGQGLISVIGPLGSLAPVVAVVLATVVLRERLRRWQSVGVLVTLAGIVLVALG